MFKNAFIPCAVVVYDIGQAPMMKRNDNKKRKAILSLQTGTQTCVDVLFLSVGSRTLLLFSAFLPYISYAYRGPSPLFVPGRRMITPRECEQCALDSVRNIVPVLNSAKTSEMWEAKAVVQATDACHVPIPQDHPLHGTRGHEGCLIYVRLSLFGRLGAVAVGDTYAVLSPAEEMDSGQSPLLLTGATLDSRKGEA